MILEKTRFGHLPKPTPTLVDRVAAYESRRISDGFFYRARCLAGMAIQHRLRLENWSPELKSITQGEH